jgi:hypothetical protein
LKEEVVSSLQSQPLDAFVSYDASYPVLKRSQQSKNCEATLKSMTAAVGGALNASPCGSPTDCGVFSGKTLVANTYFPLTVVLNL